MPDYVPEIAHSDSGVHSLDSISATSSSERSFPSYADQQLAEERAEEAREEAERAADYTAQQAQEFTQQAEEELSRLEKKAGKSYEQFSAEAKESYQQWKKTAGAEYQKAKKSAKKEGKAAKEEAKKAERWAEENKGNPVVIGNAVAISALGALLGIGAYRLHQRNELTWKVAGAWAGVVGLFAVGDYFVSQYVHIFLSLVVVYFGFSMLTECLDTSSRSTRLSNRRTIRGFFGASD